MKTSRRNAACTPSGCISIFVWSIVEPPSQVSQLRQQSLTADSTSLTWTAPASSGGRSDVFYTVICDKCSMNVAYVPAQTKFTETQVTITNLVPKTQYTVRIMSENSASSSAPSSRPAAEITFTTLEGSSQSHLSPTKVRLKLNLLSRVIFLNTFSAFEISLVGLYNPGGESFRFVWGLQDVDRCKFNGLQLTL